jgi:hypothetical protein
VAGRADTCLQYGEICLHFASFNGHADVAKVLVAEGAIDLGITGAILLEEQ